MALPAGFRLGSHEITAKLGEGGMGEVYRATDSRLRRSIAIKVLPAALTADPDRLIRFEREAQLLASLNHPNIAHVYGFESAPLPDGSSGHFIAMELVEGEDLAERLQRAECHPCRRSAADCQTDCRSARGSSRTRHRPQGRPRDSDANQRGAQLVRGAQAEGAAALRLRSTTWCSPPAPSSSL